MTMLDAAWRRCFEDLGGSMPPPCVWEELLARYREPHCAYHTLQHLTECFAWFEQVRPLAHHAGDVAFALFYHDVIYDTHASGNEALSAELATAVWTAMCAATASQILAQFLARPAIYNCSFFHERLETSARSNLERSLARLKA